MRKLGILFLSFLLVLGWVAVKTLTKSKSPGALQAPTPPRPASISTQEPAHTQSKRAQCWAYEFQLAPAGRLPELEDYLDATSLIPLPSHPINDNTLCVKADGRVIPHRLIRHAGNTELLLGPEVGPETRIRVSFCSPGARCAEKCQKKDSSFMEGLMDDAQLDEPKHTGNPTPQDADLRELRARAKELKAIARNDADLTQSGTLRNWNRNEPQEWSCKESP